MNTITPSATAALIPVTEHEGRQAVSLRDLHTFLEVSKDFTNWAKAMFEYGFTEHSDYVEVYAQKGENPSGGRPSRNWAVSLDMAKELSMIQRTDKGKQARQYFIEFEKRGQAAPTPAVLTDSYHGFKIGAPVKNLPAKPLIGAGRPFNPKTARLDRIAQLVREGLGAWLPVAVDGFTEKQHRELSKGVRYGHRKSFPRGEFNSDFRNGTLYIRHTANELTS